MDCHQIWLVGWSHGPNQLCQIFWQLIQGFQFCRGRNCHCLEVSRLTQCYCAGCATFCCSFFFVLFQGWKISDAALCREGYGCIILWDSFTLGRTSWFNIYGTRCMYICCWLTVLWDWLLVGLEKWSHCIWLSTSLKPVCILTHFDTGWSWIQLLTLEPMTQFQSVAFGDISVMSFLPAGCRKAANCRY